jgi:hypothetical protein
MQKLTEPSGDARRIWLRLFDTTPGAEIPDYAFEEFGMSAREALSNDLLIKTVADWRVSQGTSKSYIRTTVYACFNWRLQMPFLIIERENRDVASHYTPQYGRDDNYSDSWKSQTRYEFYTLEECRDRQPDIRTLLGTLD